MNYRHYLLPVVHLLVPCFAIAADVQQGGWDHRFVVSAWNPDTRTYHAIIDERRRECLSESYLSQDPFRNPEEERRRLQPRFGECSVSDRALGESTSTWSMTCLGRDGRRSKFKTTSTVSDKKVILLTEMEAAIQTADDRPLRMVREYDFVGACAPSAGSR